MTQKITIPQQNQPFRRQSSLGGNVSFREIGNNNDNTFITMAKVTKVYYQQGRINFKLTNTNDVVLDTGSTNGEGSAPIPVDFFGRKPDGTVFGHYRPIKIGDIVAIGYVGGHRSFPIVLGVYPDSNQDYEVISPSFYKDGDDNSEGIAEQGLADRKVYPSMQTDYRSGSGTIAKALNGHSYLVIDDDQVSKQYDKLWNNYNNSGFFVGDGDYINPLKEKAGEWLLIHEDNPKAEDADNHRTRFYVNHKGEMQIVFMNNNSRGNLLMLEGSRDKGFTITKYYGLDSKQSGQRDDHNFEPDLDNAQQYVKFNLGGADHSASIEATTKDDSVEQTSKLSIHDDGVYINGKLLVSSNPKFTGNTIIDDAIDNSQALNDAIKEAQQASSQAQQAGDKAIERANDVRNDINDMKENMAHYLADSKDNNTSNPNDPNKSNLWGKILNNVYLDGTNYTTKMVADVLEAGTLDGENMTFKNINFFEGKGNHISANLIDTGTLNAATIKAGSIDANKINSPELSDISKRLGKIEAGSMSIGKIDNNGNPVDPTTTSKFTDKISWKDIYQRQDPIQYTAIPADYWTSASGHTVTLKANYDVENYLKEPIAITDSDLQFGFRVHFIDKDNNESNVDVPIDTRDFYDHMSKSDIVSGAVQVPENTIKGFVYGYANIKAGSVTLGGVELSYNSPNYDNFKDAFTVGSNGHVTANSIDVGPGGTITGGTITGGTITGGTITGSTITGSILRSQVKFSKHNNKNPFAPYKGSSFNFSDRAMNISGSGFVTRNTVQDLQENSNGLVITDDSGGTGYLYLDGPIQYPQSIYGSGFGNYRSGGGMLRNLNGFVIVDNGEYYSASPYFFPIGMIQNHSNINTLDITMNFTTSGPCHLSFVIWNTDSDKQLTVDSSGDISSVSTSATSLPANYSIVATSNSHVVNNAYTIVTDSLDLSNSYDKNLGIGILITDFISKFAFKLEGYPLSVGWDLKGATTNSINSGSAREQMLSITNNGDIVQETLTGDMYNPSSLSIINGVITASSVVKKGSGGGNTENWTSNTVIDGSGISLYNSDEIKDPIRPLKFIYRNNEGVYFDQWGNIHGNSGSASWNVYSRNGSIPFSVPLNENDPIQFNRNIKVLPQGADHGIRTVWVSWSAWDNSERYPAIVQDGINWGGIAFPKSGRVTLFDHDGRYYTPDRDTGHGAYDGYGG